MPWRKVFLGSLIALGILAGAATNAQSPSVQPLCPGDQVVWVNVPTKVYHYQSERYFNNTKQGKFMCEKAALREGDRPTRNGQ